MILEALTCSAAVQLSILFSEPKYGCFVEMKETQFMDFVSSQPLLCNQRRDVLVFNKELFNTCCLQQVSRLASWMTQVDIMLHAK